MLSFCFILIIDWRKCKSCCVFDLSSKNSVKNKILAGDFSVQIRKNRSSLGTKMLKKNTGNFPSLKMVEFRLCFSKSGPVSRARVVSDGGVMRRGLLPAYRRRFPVKNYYNFAVLLLYLGPFATVEILICDRTKGEKALVNLCTQ